MNTDGGEASVSNAEGPRFVNMGGSAGSVSNVEGPRSVNMGGCAACVRNAEGPRSANMDVSAAGAKRRSMNTGMCKAVESVGEWTDRRPFVAGPVSCLYPPSDP